MSELKEKMALLAKKNEEIQRLKKDLVNESAKVFDEFRKDFFTDFPEVKSFSWNQYTPYFNDGDTCVFSANTDYIKVNGEYVDDCDWYDEKTVTNWGTYNRELKQYEGRVEVPNPNFDQRLSEATDMITKFLGQFDNDFYCSKFGDHVEVTITPDGIETEDYEHE